MAKFKKPGFTSIPDEIFDMYMADLSGAEFKVLCYIARRTYGFSKESDAISINQISTGIIRKDGRVLDKGTGLGRSTVIESLKALCSRDGHVVAEKRKQENGENEVTVYHLNLEDEVVQKSDYPPSPEIGPPWSRNQTTGVVQNLDPQETAFIQETVNNNSLPSLSEKKDQPQSQSQPQNPTHPPGSAAPPAGPTLDCRPDLADIDPETGEPYRHPDKKYKRQWSKKKEPRPSPVSDRLRAMREGAGNSAGLTPVRLADLPAMSTTPTPSAKPVERIFEDWNLAVPERPVDRSLFPRRPDAFNEAFLFERFPEVCEKARALILAGADLTFGFLMASDKSTGQYRWQQLLAGQLEWMKPKTNGKPDHKPPVDGRAMAAELRHQIKQRKEKELAARTEAENQEPGRQDL